VLKLWPIALVAWLWFSGRRRAAVYAVAATAATIVLPWAAIGFRGLRGYPSMLGDMSGDLAPNGSWLIAWLVNLGAPYRLAAAVGLLAAALLVATAALRVADATRFVLVAAGGITATATSWLHYMCVLVLPRGGATWLLLPALWLPVHVGRRLGDGYQAASTMAVVALWAAAQVIARRRSPAPRSR
jgi:hypothetical protein